MIIGLCIAGYLLTVLIFTFCFAYVDRISEPGEQVGDFVTIVFAIFWPVTLSILLGWFVVELPFTLADRYARKYNLRKKEKETQS